MKQFSQFCAAPQVVEAQPNNRTCSQSVAILKEADSSQHKGKTIYKDDKLSETTFKTGQLPSYRVLVHFE